MKYQFEVWHQRGEDLVGTFFQCDEFNILPTSNNMGFQFQLVAGNEVYETYWFRVVHSYHWGPADE